MISIQAVLRKISLDVNLDKFTSQYLAKRFRNEGVRFLTETLPKFGKLVLASIEAGRFLRKELKFTNFAWKGALLKVFPGLLSQIFDMKSGSLLPNPSPDALKRLRQVCEYFYKLALPLEEDKVEKALEAFITTDRELSVAYDTRWVDQLRKDFETHYPRLSRASIDEVLRSNGPRPGSGTFSDKEIYEKKVGLPWYARSKNDYALSHEYAGLGGLTKPIKSAPMQKQEVGVDYSEVMFVPKDSRGPRTIVREPYSNLRIQMGFHDWLKEGLEQASLGRVNFQDQQVNRDLARESSITKRWATLDLSSASDRVSARICSHVFMNSPAIRYMVARRTKKTRLPNGKFLTLNKLSGMGSGLTFPIMSLLITLTISRAITNTGIPYAQAKKLVYVYGDDIVVPTKYMKVAVESLERIQLKVGSDKSYAKGPFRESCGGDFLNGVDVVPVRLRLQSCKLEVDGNWLKVEGVLSTVAIERHARECVKAGLDNLAGYYYSVLQYQLGWLPCVSGESPVLGIYTEYLPESWLQRDETGTFKQLKVHLTCPDTHEGPTDDYIYLSSALLRTVGSNWLDGFADGVSTYNELSVPRSVKYRYRKVSALLLLG